MDNHMYNKIIDIDLSMLMKMMFDVIRTDVDDVEVSGDSGDDISTQFCSILIFF
jgi:hypothetical protein